MALGAMAIAALAGAGAQMYSSNKAGQQAAAGSQAAMQANALAQNQARSLMQPGIDAGNFGLGGILSMLGQPAPEAPDIMELLDSGRFDIDKKILPKIKENLEGKTPAEQIEYLNKAASGAQTSRAGLQGLMQTYNDAVKNFDQQSKAYEALTGIRPPDYNPDDMPKFDYQGQQPEFGGLPDVVNAPTLNTAMPNTPGALSAPTAAGPQQFNSAAQNLPQNLTQVQQAPTVPGQVQGPQAQGLQQFNTDPNNIPQFGGFQDPSQWGGYGADQLAIDPGYQFRLQEGMKGIESSAAARGLQLSGKNLKDIERFGQDLASQEFTAARNRGVQDYSLQRSAEDTSNALAAQQYGFDVNRSTGQFGQGLQAFGANLGAGQQQFGQELNAANFAANQGQQQFTNQLGAAQFGSQENQRLVQNTLGQLAQQFGQDVSSFQLDTTEKQRAFQEALAAQGFNANQIQQLYSNQMGQFGIGNDLATQQYNLGRTQYGDLSSQALQNYGIAQGQEATDYSRALQNYNLDYGRATDAFNTQNQIYMQGYNQLAGLAGMGQQNAAQTGQNALAAGQTAANLAAQQGQTNAQLTLGMGQNISNTVNTLGALPMLGQIMGSGSTTPSTSTPSSSGGVTFNMSLPSQTYTGTSPIVNPYTNRIQGGM